MPELLDFFVDCCWFLKLYKKNKQLQKFAFYESSAFWDF